MRLRRIGQGLLILALSLLGFSGGGAKAPPPVVLGTPGMLALFSGGQPQYLEPLVELSVCPEGPPTCQFERIQDAIDAAPDTAPVYPWEPPPKIPFIRILPGTYVEDLVILKNVWLQSAGRELVTLRSTGISAGLQKGEIKLREILRPAIFIAGSNYLGGGIEGLSIEGGLQIMGIVSGFIIRNNSFKIGGISLTGVFANLFITDNSITFSFVGISLFKVSKIPRADLSLAITNNEIHDNQPPLGPGEGIRIQNSEDVFIWFNSIYKNFVGINLHGGENIGIISNALKGNSTGVKAHDSQDVWIGMNRIEQNTNIGLELSSNDCTIEENKITSNGKDGIVVWSGRVQIIRNVISNNKGAGLSVYDLEAVKECEKNQVLGNRVDYADIQGQPSKELREKCERS
ncbi:MAG: right-handed parallel beta-helix repeat-containing protein [Candidatus Bipolaricaulia bacterium]